jgi:hypothetical protein
MWALAIVGVLVFSSVLFLLAKMRTLATISIVLFFVFLISMVIYVEVTESRQRRQAAKGDDMAGADGARSPDALNTTSESRALGTVMPMRDYHQYLVGLARALNTADMDTIYDHHEVFCAGCGAQFTRKLSPISISLGRKEWDSPPLR